MVDIMRTTVSIDDHLLARAKQRAREEGITLGVLLERTLQTTLSAQEPSPTPIDIPVFTDGAGLAPGVEPTTRGLLAALDEAGSPSA